MPMRFALAILALLALFLVVKARAEDHPAMGGVGDVGFRDVCPEHHVLVGFKRRMGTLTDQITTMCAPLKSDDTFGQATTPFEPHGGSGGAPQTVACNASSGVRMLAIYFTDDLRRIATLAYHCYGPSKDVIGRQLCMANSRGEMCGQSSPLLNVNLSSREPIMQYCSGGEWAVGVHGRSGKHVNALGLICAEVEPVFVGIDVRTTPSKVITNNATEKPFETSHVVDIGKVKSKGGIFTAPPKPSGTTTPLPPPATAPPLPPQDPGMANDGFSGTWATVTASGSRYTMQLFQSGRKIRGSYARPDGVVVGAISGKVKGGTLTYRWEEGGSQGSGRFKLADDGNAFEGWWNSTDEPDDIEGSWNGTRK
jgi:hypothetical protein